jgi:ribosome-binding protein aMBF1 (putative translation factor)
MRILHAPLSACTNAGTDLSRADQETRPVPAADPEVLRLRSQFGATVRRLRQGKGWTQEDLAHRTGFDRKSINRIENASYSPAVDRLFPLAAALDVTAADLLADVAPMRPRRPPRQSPARTAR